MIALWDYQEKCIADLREAFRSHRRVLLQAPTGSGKTVMFAFMADSHLRTKGRDAHVLVLAHRQELLEQIEGAFKERGQRCTVLSGGRLSHAGHGCTVSSVQSAVRHLDAIRPPTLIICDEAHHCISGSTWGRVVDSFPDTPLLGVSATPVRLDGAGLGNTFERLVLGPATGELIRRGYLAPLRVFAPPLADTSKLHRRYGEFIRGEVADAFDKPTITGDAIEHYRWHADGRRAVVFCVSVQHAGSVARAFSDSGIPAFSVDGGLHSSVRRDRISAFRHGRVPVLTSCDLISEGFDVPDIECGISLRPTASLGLWFQQVGRCLRRAPGKEAAIILDHAGNCLRHGLPTDDVEWTLDKGFARKGSGEVGIKVCDKCFGTNSVRARTCMVCGKEFAVEPRTVKEVEGQLFEFTEDEYKAYRDGVKRDEVAQAHDFAALEAIEKARGYKKGWAARKLMGRKVAAQRKASA